MAWKDEYERRLRRVAGVTDDTVDVYVDEDIVSGRDAGGCDTCGWGSDESSITVYAGDATKVFYGTSCFSELMSALEAVPDEDVSDD